MKRDLLDMVRWMAPVALAYLGGAAEASGHSIAAWVLVFVACALSEALLGRRS